MSKGWISEYQIRSMAEAIAPRIAPAVEGAVLETVRSQLPGILMDELRRILPDRVPKKINVRARNEAIRAEYNGHNVAQLARKHLVSVRQVQRIIKL